MNKHITTESPIIGLYYQSSSSDKVYVVMVEHWPDNPPNMQFKVVAIGDRRTAPMYRTYPKTWKSSFEAAATEANDILSTKRKEGYRDLDTYTPKTPTTSKFSIEWAVSNGKFSVANLYQKDGVPMNVGSSQNLVTDKVQGPRPVLKRGERELD